MESERKTKSGGARVAWLAAALCALGLMGPSSASAQTPSANLDLKVTLSGSLSVKVDGVQYATRTLSGGAGSLLAPSSSTVTNDSSGLTEQWSLSVATVSGGGNWSAAASTQTAPGLDQYALQALFISSHAAAACPGTGNARWDTQASVVTGSGQNYIGARYADSTATGGVTGAPDVSGGGSDGNMYATSGTGVGRRGLCTRVYMPSGSTSPAEQVIRLTVTAGPGV